MEGVGTRLRDDVQLTAGHAAILGRVNPCQQLELLDHLDHRRSLTNAQQHIQLHIPTDIQRNVLQHLLAEARQLTSHLIRSRNQRVHKVPPVRVGLHLARDAGASIQHRHIGIGNRSTGNIDDGARDGRGGGLCQPAT